MTRLTLALALVALLLVVGLSEGEPSNSRDVIQASEILVKIERGEPVEYAFVIIEGDLDLSELNLPTKHVERTENEIEILGLSEEMKVVDSLISITDSEIRGNVRFGNTIFMNSTIFERTNFSGDAYFRYAQFSGYADFRFAQFSGDYANFQFAQFNCNADFQLAKFSGYTTFLYAQFSRDAHFCGAQFSGDYANFQFAQFNCNADFMYTQFSDNRNVVTDFENASFDGSISFEDTQFSPCADFRAAQFNNSLDLTHARFDRLELRWSSIENHLKCDDTAYMALINNYKSLAWSEDADNCLYDYRRWKQGTENFGWSKITDIVSWLSCGYGVRPIYTIICSITLILFFGIIFWKSDVIQESTYPCKQSTGSKSFTDTLYFSTLVFVSQPPHDWRPKGHWKYAVMIEDVLGWLLLALFLVTLGNVMIR